MTPREELKNLRAKLDRLEARLAKGEKVVEIEKLDKKNFRVFPSFGIHGKPAFFYYNPQGELLDKVNEIIEVLNARRLKRGKGKL